MKLWSVCDDSSGLDSDERCYLAIWADDEAAAKAEYRRVYPGIGEADAEYVASMPIRATESKAFASPQKAGTHVDSRHEVHREMGWQYEGDDHMCEVCDMYACDLEEYAVCEECYTCRACRVAGFGVCCGECGPDIDEAVAAEEVGDG